MDGVIEHLIVSFYTRRDPTCPHNEQSSVKFGSWDQSGIEDGESLKMIRTKGSYSW
jgi:hypothetical protein